MLKLFSVFVCMKQAILLSFILFYFLLHYRRVSVRHQCNSLTYFSHCLLLYVAARYICMYLCLSTTCVLASWFLYQLKIVFCGKDLDWAPLLLSVNSWLTHIRKTSFPCPTNVSVPVLSVKDLPMHWQRPRFLSSQFQLGVMSVIKFIYLCFVDKTTRKWLKYDISNYY